MQASGGYKGGRMLFLVLGTGLGSAMISMLGDSLELAHLPYKKAHYRDYVGLRGPKRRGAEPGEISLDVSNVSAAA